MNPIAQGISDFFTNLVNNTLTGFYGAVGPIANLLGNTPENLTTGNPVIHTTWLVMVAVADGFLGLYVIMKIIQMMHGDATGTIHTPIGQFIPKVILTVILIHASAFLGQQILLIINTLCGMIQANTQDIIRLANNGQMLDGGQFIGLSLLLGILAGISFIRVILQAIKRIIFFDVLFVLSGPAFLMSLDAQTAPWFAFWLRTYVANILTQLFQFLTLSLGLQLLTASNANGFTGFLLAIGMLNLAAEIPDLLSRFAASSGASAPSVGEFIRSAATAVMVFI